MEFLMDERKILFVLPWLPFPLDSGGRQAIFNGIKAAAGNAKIYITFKTAETPVDSDVEGFTEQIGACDIIPFIEHRPVVEKKPESFCGKCLNVYKAFRHSAKLCLKKLAGIRETPSPVAIEPEYKRWLSVLYPFDESFALFVRNLVIENNIDIVQCEMLRNIGIVYFLPETVKKIFVHHELGMVRHRLESEQIEGEESIKNAYLKFFEGCEVEALNQYDVVITLSETDKQKLISFGVKTNVEASTAVVSTHVSVINDTDRFHTLSFLGNDLHSPNLVGIKWFLDNCWGTLLEKDENYNLQMVGKWSEPVREEISNNYRNVSFTGFVPDLSDVIEGTIMIVPITVGSGIRMKILEAASIGCPIVSTSIGAEGIPMVDGSNCYLADNPLEFVYAILKLKDESIRKSFVLEARKMVMRHYSYDAFAEGRIKIFERLINS